MISLGLFPDGGYILTIIDTFTRWVELFHTPDATAMSATKCLVKHFARFEARVVYPFKVYTYETEQYEYRKNSFMKFNPIEKNKNYKIFDETGYYRSTVDNISEYFLA